MNLSVWKCRGMVLGRAALSINKSGLERWLSSKNHLLLLQRTGVPFQVPTSSVSQTPVTPSSRYLMPSFVLNNQHVHFHIYTHSYINDEVKTF